MVSKIAVIALVAIVACPILLGYAMNLTESTETEYRAEGEAVNVTPLLRTSSSYNYAYADDYQMNSDIRIGSVKTLPVFERTSSSKTSFPLTQTKVSSWTCSGTQMLSGLSTYAIHPYYDHTAFSVNFAVKDGNNSTIWTVSNFETLYYIAAENRIYYSYYNGSTITDTYFVSSAMNSITFTHSSPFTPPDMVYSYQYNTGNTQFVDLSKGYRMVDPYYTDNENYHITLPQNTKKSILTVDLDSITDSSYSITIAGLHLVKTTTAGIVSWTALDVNYNVIADLYYNQSGGNTYQIYTEYNYPDPTYREIRYVGAWPTFIGEANYYLKYSYESNLSINQNITFYLETSSVSPIVRLDLAEFRAFELPVIENQTYNPADFKTNPATTISDLQIYGSSLTFGGNTYTVNQGKITINSHEVPINNLVFSSVPDGNGSYNNKIGNTVISTTANPSTITFNGKWSASISTIAQESYTYTHTEWVAGHFAWDGMDQNFLLVGLITCLGVFIALGIYARKRGSGGLIPLMIAVGCAAAVFFIML